MDRKIPPENQSVDESNIRTKYQPKTQEPQINEIFPIEQDTVSGIRTLNLPSWKTPGSLIETTGPIEISETLEMPREKVFTMSDVHGNARGFLMTLLKAGIIKIKDHKVSLTESGKDIPVVVTGDFFDRGPHSLKLLDYFQAFFDKHARLELVAGDHELMALAAIDNISADHRDEDFFELVTDLTGKIHPLERQAPDKLDEALKWKATERKFRQNGQPLVDANNFMQWYIRGGESLIREIKDKYYPGEKNVPMRALLVKAHTLLQPDTNYGRLMRQLLLCSQIDDILYTHAGVDDQLAELFDDNGVDGTNSIFKATIRHGNYGIFSQGDLCKILWKRENGVSPYAASVLKKLGITTVISGHNRMRDGIQQAEISNGIMLVSNDIGLESGIEGGTMIMPDGEIQNYSDNLNHRQGLLAKLPPLKPGNQNTEQEFPGESETA